MIKPTFLQTCKVLILSDKMFCARLCARKKVYGATLTIVCIAELSKMLHALTCVSKVIFKMGRVTCYVAGHHGH